MSRSHSAPAPGRRPRSRLDGFVLAQLFSVDYAADTGILITLVGAFAGGRILGELGARMIIIVDS